MLGEVRKKQEQFGYESIAGKIHFKKNIVAQHKKRMTSLRRYLTQARLLTLITAPVIWSCLIPALLLDAVLSFYQFVCFPIYGIPKVERKDYIVLDRYRLSYLNSIEKFNCTYCAYFNGLIAYVQEIAGRTEQYWCPIKHAIRMKTMHSRYRHFVDYGDAEQYRKRLLEISREFEDLKKK